MDFSLLYQLKNKKSQIMGPLFYVACAVLVATVVCYYYFAFQVYFQKQKIDQVNKNLLAYGTPEQKLSEQQVFAYKKQIDDFTAILHGHTLSSNVFNFVQDNTLSNVWFSNMNVSQTKDEINLQGEAQDMQTLSRQIDLFEKSKEYVKGVSVVSSQIDQQGKVKFILKFDLDPKIFQ